MIAAPFETIHLHRVDSARNMARFYCITIERTLFGETIVRRSWGRIGTVGRSRTMVVDAVEEAVAIARAFGQGKRRRGYSDICKPSRFDSNGRTSGGEVGCP